MKEFGETVPRLILHGNAQLFNDNIDIVKVIFTTIVLCVNGLLRDS